MAADFWSDLRLILTLVLFVYIVQWAISQTGDKKLGVIVGSIVAYLTIYQHWEMIVFIVVVFFGYNFFYRLEETTRMGEGSGIPKLDSSGSFQAGDRGPFVQGGMLGLSGKGWYNVPKKEDKK